MPACLCRLTRLLCVDNYVFRGYAVSVSTVGVNTHNNVNAQAIYVMIMQWA